MINDKYDHSFRLIIIGESGVGKTNLLQRFSENIFKENQLNTIGKSLLFKFNKIYL